MLRTLLAFAAFAAVVTITPGLDTMLVVRTAAVSGRRAAFATAGGIMIGLTTNLLNPKVGVFYLSVLPQFLPHGVSPLLASTAMALVHNIEGLLWFTALVFLVRRAARVLSRPAVRRRLDQVTGVVFLAFGLRLAFQAHRTSA